MAEQAIIHHYPAGDRTPNVVSVPVGTRILSAALRRGKVVVYVEKIVQAPDVEHKKLYVEFQPTGGTFDIDGSMKFIGTVTDGPFVWHVYGKIV